MEWDINVFANNIRKYCMLNGVSQSDLARILGVSPTSIANWFNAKKFPRIDKIQRMAEYLHIEVSDLLLEENIKESIERNDLDEELLLLFHDLSSLGQSRLLEYAHFLLSGGYNKK